MLFCSLRKGRTPKIRMLCFVIKKMGGGFFYIFISFLTFYVLFRSVCRYNPTLNSPEHWKSLRTWIGLSNYLLWSINSATLKKKKRKRKKKRQKERKKTNLILSFSSLFFFWTQLKHPINFRVHCAERKHSQSLPSTRCPLWESIHYASLQTTTTGCILVNSSKSIFHATIFS